MIGLVNNFHPYTGIGKSSFNLLKKLNELGEKTEMVYCETRSNKINTIPNVKKITQGMRYPVWNHTLSEYYNFPSRIPSGFELYHVSSQYLSRVSKFRKPCIISHMDIAPLLFPKDYPFILRLFLRKMIKHYKNAEEIIAISESSKNDLLEFVKTGFGKNFLSEDAVTTIPLGYDEKIYKKMNKQKCRKILGLPKDKKIILNVGSEEPRKNMPLLFKAQKMVQDAEDAVLVRLGGRNKDYDPLRKGINVLYLSNISEESMPLLYNSADVFVFPSIYEGFGYPPLESMACGIPTIITNKIELFKRGSFVLEKTDVKTLSDKILDLLSSHLKHKKLSDSAIDASKEFTLKKQAEKTLKIYDQVI